jgi:hypothetical protein
LDSFRACTHNYIFSNTSSPVTFAMFDPEATQIPESVGVEAEVEMVDDAEVEEADAGGPVVNGPGEETATAVNPQKLFLDYLKSPIVELVIGGGRNGGDEETTVIIAHEALLTKSPFFAERLSELSDSDPRRIELPDETIDAVGCFLQYQYTGEYFPRRLPTIHDGLEPDPSLPAVDETGAQLLKHARVYNLAEKLGLPDLKTLAHSKIHLINSTAVAEIAYARYVYGNPGEDDITIRRQVAAFWAARSHVLRHEAEEEFRAMCLEFPQFGFDVLSLVLDKREKRGRERDQREGTEPTLGKARKRMRPSVNI